MGCELEFRLMGCQMSPLLVILFSQSNSKNKGVHVVKMGMGHLSPILPQSFQTGGWCELNVHGELAKTLMGREKPIFNSFANN